VKAALKDLLNEIEILALSGAIIRQRHWTVPDVPKPIWQGRKVRASRFARLVQSDVWEKLCIPVCLPWAIVQAAL
jgi:hypothetical protein